MATFFCFNLAACGDDDDDDDGGKGASTRSYTSCPNDKHPHAIDLGLPSGTKWACCNVGASSPEQYGDYFAWGETSPKSYYGPSTYQFSYIYDKGRYYDYRTDKRYDVLISNIGSDIVGTKYDAATANWGSPWVMPSANQISELRDYCTYEWVAQSGVYGGKFTGLNGGTIFLPAAGGWDGGLVHAGDRGHYWSSTSLYLNSRAVDELLFDSEVVYLLGASIFCGLSVRPVRTN